MTFSVHSFPAVTVSKSTELLGALAFPALQT